VARRKEAEKRGRTLSDEKILRVWRAEEGLMGGFAASGNNEEGEGITGTIKGGDLWEKLTKSGSEMNS